MQKTLTRAGLAALALTGIACLLTVPGLAEEAATPPAAPPPNFNKGDAAWMMTSTVLVLLMTIPGLALFYAGLVRPKNALSVLTHVFYTVCIVMLIWVIYGYSLAFTGGTSIIGGFDKLFLKGVTGESPAATFSVGVPLSEIIYICFQMTFAAITPALIVGAFAERMKFSAVALFIPLWVTFIYFPIAHMVWYWAGPDAIARCGQCRLRTDLLLGRHRLRGRHRGAHQRRYCGSGWRDHGRPPYRLWQGADASPLAGHDHDRRSVALGRLVRVQRGLGPDVWRPCWDGIRGHPHWCGFGGDCLDAGGVGCQG